jgi:SARP family transcriptional regulator, regulator of embCAB operon
MVGVVGRGYVMVGAEVREGDGVSVLRRRREDDRRRRGAQARVVVVDDHRTFAELLTGALDHEPDLVSVGHATTAREGIELSLCARPDVIIMDVELPDLDGFTATERLLEAMPDAKVLILTAHATAEFVARAAAAGACAFLPKDGSLQVLVATLRAAVEQDLTIHPALGSSLAPRPSGRAAATTGALTAGPQLTEREAAVLALMGDGKDVTAIARELHISASTCRGYIKSLLAKLGAHSQLEAVVLATRHGMLQLGG